MYYAAIICPAQINDKVLQYKQWMKEQFGCTAALKSPAHITLVPPFWFETAKENELLQTLQSFTSVINHLEIHLYGFSHFGKRVLFIGVPENFNLNRIKNETEGHFTSAFAQSIKKDDRPFHPHVTIATRDMKPSHFEKAWEYFSRHKFDETFTTKTISLLKLGDGKWNVPGEKDWQVQKNLFD